MVELGWKPAITTKKTRTLWPIITHVTSHMTSCNKTKNSPKCHIVTTGILYMDFRTH